MPHCREVSPPGRRVNATRRPGRGLEHLLKCNDRQQHGQARGNEQNVEPHNGHKIRQMRRMCDEI
jgi:hypothetical protein